MLAPPAGHKPTAPPRRMPFSDKAINMFAIKPFYCNDLRQLTQLESHKSLQLALEVFAIIADNVVNIDVCSFE